MRVTSGRRGSVITWSEVIPLLHEEGWMRLKKISRSLISAADGVVEPAESCQHARPPRPLRCGGFAAFY
jgi:hypothetical protein